MAGDSNTKHHTDWDEKVQCGLKHIPSSEVGLFIGRNIKTVLNLKLFNIDGLAACAQKSNGEFSFVLTRREADELRNKLEKILTIEYPSVWLTLYSKPMHSFIGRSLNEDDEENHRKQASYEAYCRFGSLLSYDTFYSHISLENTVRTVYFNNVKNTPDSLTIELDEGRLLTISLNSIQKRKILVNIVKRETEALLLLPLKYAPHITQPDKSDSEDIYTGDSNRRRMRMCYDSNNPAINSISKSSDLVLQFKPLNDIGPFLAYLTAGWKQDTYEINFSCFKAHDWQPKWTEKQLSNPFHRPQASFQDRYGLQMLRSLGHVYRDKSIKLNNGNLGWDSWNPDDRYALCCYAAERLRDDHGYDLRRTAQDYYARKKSITSENDNEQSVHIERKHQIQVAVCTLTPLRTIFQPMELTAGSRALRNERFEGPKRFLLVHFRDEDNRVQRNFNESVRQRLRNSMLLGIKSLDRTFKFIGTSTGQMKELAFWFIDLPSDIPDIIAAHRVLGQFDGIKNIAQYVARVGQYFSTTWPIGIQLKKIQRKEDMRTNSGIYYVLEIPDIKKGDYCFTDGIGLISWGLAGRVAQKMNIDLARKEDIPSAFQVRIAGCKGMVAIDPKSTLDEYYMFVRDSMIKFPSDNWDLEICEYARPMALSFNNQVIRLLRDLGNSDAVFLGLQTQGLDKSHIPEDQLPSVIDMALQKPMFYSSSKENLLKNRIPVPVDDGRNLFGVADETQQLNYGECFVQYSLADSNSHGQRKFRVVTGPVLVTKNPCMYPGDFRRLNAVRNDLLEASMRDVIVFPTTGNRPHCNEISGSDLDGDQYWVYWGKDLTITKQYEPLSYKGAVKKDAPMINQETIVDHIVNTFGAGGIIGIISNTHTVIADKSPKHSLDPACIDLANMFARAVDAPKTGEEIPIGPVRQLQRKWCRESPQFMQKFSERQYESTEITEKLFLIAKEKYFEGKETPMLFPLPQLPRKAKTASPFYIADKTFAKWVNNNNDQGLTNSQEDTSSDNSLKQPRKRQPRKKQEDDAQSNLSTPFSPTPGEQERFTDLPNKSMSPTPSESSVASSGKQSTQPKQSDTATSSKKLTSTKKPLPVADDKSISTASASLPIMNSDSRSTTSLSIDSASLPDSVQSVEYTTDLIIAIEGRMTTATVLEFSSISADALWAVDLKRAKTRPPEKEDIANSVKTVLQKLDVFKKTSSYKENLYGPLCLIVSYGQIRFNLPADQPRTFGDLKALINAQSNVIQFVIGKKDLLDSNAIAFQASNSGTTVYEFDCKIQGTSPSEYITFLFDDKKKLKQARRCHIWSKCYLREIDAATDSLYELFSMSTYKSGTTEFERLVRSAFVLSDSTDLLTGKKPNIIIKQDLLQANIVQLRLKIVEEKLIDDSGSSDYQRYYREVKYVSLSQEQVKSKVFETVEFLTVCITKDDDLLSRVCDDATSLVENKQLVQQSGATSNASSSDQWMKILN